MPASKDRHKLPDNSNAVFVWIYRTYTIKLDATNGSITHKWDENQVSMEIKK